METNHLTSQGTSSFLFSLPISMKLLFHFYFFFTVDNFLTLIFSSVAHTFSFQRTKIRFTKKKVSKRFQYHCFSFNLAIQYFTTSSHLSPLLFLVPRVLDIVLSLSGLLVGSIVLSPPAVPNPAPLWSRWALGIAVCIVVLLNQHSLFLFFLIIVSITQVRVWFIRIFFFDVSVTFDLWGTG